jgi:hypothetical protein
MMQFIKEMAQSAITAFLSGVIIALLIGGPLFYYFLFMMRP